MDLRTWRKERGFTLKELARLCGIAEPTLSAYERGSRTPRPNVAKRIEAATNGEVTAAQLLGLEGIASTDLALRDRIRLEMASQGLNQRALANKAGLNESYVRDLFENPQQDPRLSKIVALAEALGKSASWLFNGTPETSSNSQLHAVQEDSAKFDPGERPWRAPATVSVDITLTAGELEDIQKHLPDYEIIAAEGARAALKAAYRKAWSEANREAIEANNRWIEEHGTFAEQLGLI